ncbi:MAG: isoprenylcysteine carboxylmethyltransferase family protein [Anaerolineae bacterium]|nr:isoprenylcysteine carboxylmethyltransferase family protein [Anaerolineae bacterium]
MPLQETGFFWVFFAVICYGVIHSLLASNQVKAFASRRFGKFANRYYRLFFNLMAGVTLLPALALVVLLPDRTLYITPFPWVILTLGVQAAASICLLIGVQQTGTASFLGISQLFDRPAKEPAKLVESGFYRYVRHPLYSFSLAILWLMPYMTFNILAFNIGATLYLTIGSILEEKKLIEEFGETYIAYRQRTPMFFPIRIKKR